MEKYTQGVSTKIGIFSGWKDWIVRTKFNLAPRGYGATSFRLAEVVQLERIPVYIYSKNDRWAPYEHSNISIDSIGYSGEMGSLGRLMDQLRQVSDVEFAEKLERVKLARHYYTYEGVMDQIEMFFRAPLVEGALSCQRVPQIHTWAFWWESVKFQFFCYLNPEYSRYCPQQLAVIEARIP